MDLTGLLVTNCNFMDYIPLEICTPSIMEFDEFSKVDWTLGGPSTQCKLH